MENQHGPVAQWIERRFPKPCVGGSNPLGAATYIRFIWINIPETPDTTAFAVVFHLLGIRKNFARILHGGEVNSC